MIDDLESAPADPLDQFAQLFNTPVGQSFAEEARVRLQDYAMRRGIAEANTAAGDAFASNLSEIRGNFMGLVERDPLATHLALDLAELGVGAMVGTVPGTSPEQAMEIATGMQRDIARTAVRSLAERHEEGARGLLGDERIGGLLGDEREALGGYITAQSIARRVDSEAQQRMAERAATEQANRSAWNYMAAMVDPETGEIGYPSGWAGRVMADPSMTPETKAALFDTYGRLTENGDVGRSDSLVVRDLVRGLAGPGVSPTEILSRAGDDLRAADAVYLAGLAADPTQRNRAVQLSTVLDQGKVLAAPENGPAGRRAYSEFAEWTLANARNGADLDPASQNYILSGNRLQQFAPRATYNVEAAIPAPTQGRRSLSEIFGGRGGS
ncbi:MAG: hypothetical protein AB7H90_03465 [Alphaproteobacteria bacterium]